MNDEHDNVLEFDTRVITNDWIGIDAYRVANGCAVYMCHACRRAVYCSTRAGAVDNAMLHARMAHNGVYNVLYGSQVVGSSSNKKSEAVDSTEGASVKLMLSRFISGHGIVYLASTTNGKYIYWCDGNQCPHTGKSSEYEAVRQLFYSHLNESKSATHDVRDYDAEHWLRSQGFRLPNEGDRVSSEVRRYVDENHDHTQKQIAALTEENRKLRTRIERLEKLGG